MIQPNTKIYASLSQGPYIEIGLKPARFVGEIVRVENTYNVYISAGDHDYMVEFTGMAPEWCVCGNYVMCIMNKGVFNWIEFSRVLIYSKKS